MFIGNHHISFFILNLICFIAFWKIYFFHTIADRLASFLFRQLAEGMSPFIVRWQFNRLSYFFIICIQLNLDGFWTEAILVIGIIPLLSDFHLCKSWFMRVGQDNISLVLIIYRHLVTIWDSNFFNRISNGFSSCLGIKVFKCTFPIIRCRKF